MEKFKNEAAAIAAVEKLVEKYKNAPYLDKATLLKQLEELDIPEEFAEARHLQARYTEMSPITAMQRAQRLVHRFATLPKGSFSLPLRQEAESMLAGLPRTKEYDAIRDLLRHYATRGD